MASNLSWMWRGKFPLLISGSINVILTVLLISSAFKKNGERSLQKNRRELEGGMSSHKTVNLEVQGERDFFIFVLILTAPNSEDRRNAIRETWLKLHVPRQFSIVHKFAVGATGLDDEQRKKLTIENSKYEDILFLNELRDSYQNLSLKVLLCFKWISENVNAKFVLKADDDSFVQLAILAKDLAAKEKFGRIYWGFFRGDANVKPRGPWAEPNWVLCDKYLPYAHGGGYVLSQDLVQHISKQEKMLQLYNSEDISVAAWLAPVRLNRVHDVRFDTEYKSRGCNDKHIVSHKQSTSDMFSKYNELTNNNRLCAKESVKRLSYEYDWKVKPSKCCKRIPGIP